MSLTLTEVQTIIGNLRDAMNNGAQAVEYSVEGRTVKLGSLDEIRRNLDHYLRVEKIMVVSASGLNTHNKVARFS